MEIIDFDEILQKIEETIKDSDYKLGFTNI